jgi:hypothetical protein
MLRPSRRGGVRKSLQLDTGARPSDPDTVGIEAREGLWCEPEAFLRPPRDTARSLKTQQRANVETSAGSPCDPA